MEGFTNKWVDGEEITLTIGNIVNPFSELSAGMNFRIQITD
jgi:hypothetical protein